MLITDYITETCIQPVLQARDKEGVIKELADLQLVHFSGLDREAVLAGLFERESVMSTGIGNGIAVPHARLDCSSEITVSFGLSREGIDFQSLDQQLVRIVLLALFPKNEVNLQLRFLARVSRLLQYADLRERLLGCGSAEEVIEAFQQFEAVHFH